MTRGMDLFANEFLGTGIFAALCVAATCAARLPRSAATGMPHAALAAAWGAALAAGMFAARRGDVHLNPAVTFAAWMLERCSGGDAGARIGGQFAGMAAGALLAALAFLPQLARAVERSGEALWRTPEVRAPLANLLSSAAASAILVFVMLRLACGAAIPEEAAEAGEVLRTLPPYALAHRAEAALVAGVAMFAAIAGFGAVGAPVVAGFGAVGRAVHVLLPLPGKSRTDWRDAWLSIAGPALGAMLAVWAWRAVVD